MDPKSHDEPLRGGFGRGAACGTKLFDLPDDVVGREHKNQRFRVPLGRKQGGNRNRRSGIPAHGFKHDVRADGALAQLFGYDKAEVRVGDHDRATEQFRIGDAPHHLLER